MGGVFFRVLAVCEDVVEIGCAELVSVRSEGPVNILLKGGGGIFKTKGHDQEFKETVTGAEGCFPLVSFLDADQVVGVPDVNLLDDFGFGNTS